MVVSSVIDGPTALFSTITISTQTLLPIDGNRHTSFVAARCVAGEEKQEAVEVLKAAGPGRKKQGGKGGAPKDKHTRRRGKAAPDEAVKEEDCE